MKKKVDFYTFTNKEYLKQKIPNNQSSVNNFIDITDRTNKRLIEIFDNLNNNDDIDDNSDTNIKINKLLQVLYEKRNNYSNITQLEEEITCKKIIKIIKEIEDKELSEKIVILRKYGINIFMSYNTFENPCNDIKKPYIIDISKNGLSFSKEYYFDKKYEHEINGFKKYNRDLLQKISGQYTKYFNYSLDKLNNICDDFDYIESLLAPYILSNTCSRNVDSRINIYKLKEINSKFKNLNILNSSILNEYIFEDKSNIDINFSSNINKCMKPSNTHYEINLYNKLDDLGKYKYDDGDYYWYFLDDLFLKYKTKELSEKIDNYILWSIINNFSGLISDEIRIEKFKFYGTFLNGQQIEKPNKERTINYLMEILPELVGKLYCDNFFQENHVILIKELVNYVIDAYEYNFKYRCKWLDDKNSLNEALKKIERLKLEEHQKIGYPIENTYMSNYDILFNLLGNIKNIEGYSLFDFELIFNKWYIELDIIKYKRVTLDLTSWSMSAAQTNAYYNPLKNEIVFPAGILQEPFFIFLSNEQLKNKGIDLYNDIYYSYIFPDRIRLSKLNSKYESLRFLTMASNFGSIGVVIGHEISHGFDDQGSKFDYNGKFKSWWSDSVKHKYNIICDTIVKQYNKYKIDIDNQNYNINGKLTLGENIADLFGLIIAINAFKKYYNDNILFQVKSLDDSLIELFVAFSNTWRNIILPQDLKMRITNDVHSPAMFRVIGTLNNIKDYYNLFFNKKIKKHLLEDSIFSD